MIVAGNRQHGLNDLVERKSRLTHISFLENKTAAATKQGILPRLNRYPAALTQLITDDHGNENTLHEEINDAIDTQSFFVRPLTVGRKAASNKLMG